MKGQIEFPAWDPLPPFLSRRLEGTVDGEGNRLGPDAAFRKNIRQYNNAFQFTSVKCNINTHGLNAAGPMDFQVHGSLYHFAGPLEPAAGETAAFAQLYFYDAQSAADIRGNNNLRDREFLIALHDFLETRNPFYRLYLTAKERLAQSNGPERILITPRMELVVEQGADLRRENLPVADEIAVLIPEEWGEKCFRDIVLAERGEHGHTSGLQMVNPFNAAYLPLAYPLMFPTGQTGFHWGLKWTGARGAERDNDHLSFNAWCRYILHVRPGNRTVPFKISRLFQQFIVDLWAAGDQHKLYWLRNHQQVIRAELYSGINDWIRDTDILGIVNMS